jgi:hypothetical protein
MLPKIMTQVQKLHSREKATMQRVDLDEPSSSTDDDAAAVTTCEGFHRIWLRTTCDAMATRAPVTKLKILIRFNGTVQDPCLLVGRASSAVALLPAEPELRVRGRSGSSREEDGDAAPPAPNSESATTG